MIPPEFTHDCTDCQYLGPYQQGMDGQRHDLYYCPKSDGGSVLARFNDEPSGYMSFMLGVVFYAQLQGTHPLVEAARRKVKDWQEIERRYESRRGDW